MKNNIREQRAITLVALIITIIVLLILAIVSIRLVMNEGIIDRANRGVNEYSKAQEIEQIQLGYQEYKMAKYTGASSQLNVEGASNITGDETSGWTIEFSTERIYGLGADGTITEGGIQPSGGTTTLSTVTKDNYGDYIDLGQNVIGTSATTDDWRILYNDKAGHVYAILADYLPNNNAAVTASGLNVVSGKTYDVNSITSRDDLLSKLTSNTAWQSLIPEGLRSTCQVKGATTGEILMASYNEKYGTSLDYTSKPYFRTNPNDNTSSIDTLYMPHPGSIDYNGCYGYWLASPNAVDPDYVWFVAFDGHVRNGGYDDPSGYGVCPVVSLSSDIQVTKNGAVWTVVQ